MSRDLERFITEARLHHCRARGPMRFPVHRVSGTLFSSLLVLPMKKMMRGPTRVEHEVQPGPRLIVVGEQRCKLDSPPFRSFLRSSRPRSIVHASVRSLVQLASHGTQSVVVTDEARFSCGHMSEQVGPCFSVRLLSTRLRRILLAVFRFLFEANFSEKTEKHGRAT